MRFELRRVQFMPKLLAPGVLYVAEEFGAAAHLCACGCGEKVRTPLGPVDWSVVDEQDGPTLWPSIGNWQQPCKSHYWIRKGEVVWGEQWTEEEIAEGRAREWRRAQEYYASLARHRESPTLRRIHLWLRTLVKKIRRR